MFFEVFQNVNIKRLFFVTNQKFKIWKFWYCIILGNYSKAADILSNLEKVVPNLMQVTYRRINLARRSGNLETASELYEQYISQAKNRVFANNMAIKYARFCWKVSIVGRR